MKKMQKFLAMALGLAMLLALAACGNAAPDASAASGSAGGKTRCHRGHQPRFPAL